MKKLNNNQIELVVDGSWGSFACQVGTRVVGAAIGGILTGGAGAGVGLIGGAIVGNIICNSTPAY